MLQGETQVKIKDETKGEKETQKGREAREEGGKKKAQRQKEEERIGVGEAEGTRTI